MFAQQYEKVCNSRRVINDLVKSIQHIPLPRTTVPNGKDIEKALQKAVGRTLTDAEGKYLSPEEWFTHLINKKFPVTDYIRPMKDLAFTPLPDLFHEYFWHMPQMFLQEFADMEEFTAKLYFMATTVKQQAMIYNFSRYSIEYGMLREEGVVKARWAWLLSSPGDLDRVINDKFIYEEASLEWILATKTSPHKPHKKLFVFRSIQHVRDILFTIENSIKKSTL